MYTTLSMLKQVEACKPGFGRMLSFFGIDRTIRDQRIPLHVVALVGNLEDANWTMSNGLIIDPAEFLALRRRHLVPMFMYRLYREYLTNADRRTRVDKKPAIKALFDRALKLRTYEEIDSFLKEVQYSSFDQVTFKEVLRNDMWTDPLQFILALKNMTGNKISTSDSWFYESQIQRDYIPHIYLAAMGLPPETSFEPLLGSRSPAKKSKVPAGRRRSVSMNDDDEADSDDDEDDAPRRAPAAQRRARMVASDVQQIDSSTTAVIEAVSAGTSTKIEQVVKPISIPDCIYIFKDYMPKRGSAENFARLLSTTPFDFMKTMKYKLPKQVKVAVTNDVMTVTVTDSESMLRIVRSLNSASATFNGDEIDDMSDDEDEG